MIAKSDYNYKTDLEIWEEKRNVSAKTIQGVEHLWNQFLLVKKRQTPKQQQRTIQKRKEKAQKEYVPEDPGSDPSLLDSLLS